MPAEQTKMPVKSFVTDILAVAGKLEKEDLTTKLAQVSQRVEEVKIEVHEALHRKYADFQPSFDATTSLRNRISTIDKDMDSLHSSIEKQAKGQVRVSATEYENLYSNYEESKSTVLLLNGLLEINEGLQTLSSYINEQKLILAAKLLVRLDEVFAQLYSLAGKELKILPHLRDALRMHRERLHTKCEHRWSDYIEWCHEQEEDDTDNKRKVAQENDLQVRLSFNKSKECSEHFLEALQALATMNQLQKSVKIFSNYLLKHILTSVLCNPKASVVSKQGTDCVGVVVVMKKGTKHEQVKSQQDCLEVLNHFNVVLDGLGAGLSGFRVTCAGGDESLDESGFSLRGSGVGVERSFLQEVGCAIKEKMSDMIVSKCLTLALPTDHKDLQNFAPVLKATLALQARLVKLEILPADDKTLTDYVSNIGVMFVNKKCQNLLERSRSLMMTPLHNVVTITPSGPYSASSLDLPTVKSTSSSPKTSETISKENLSEALGQIFDFPKCQISTGVRDLVDLAYEALHEAAALSNDTTAATAGGKAVLTAECAVQLFYTVRSVFELYISMVPAYHRDQLASLPLFAAVHHNDCLYIAHHLSILGSQYRTALPKPLSSGLATFIDLIPVLRRLGVKSFLDQMSSQKSHILELFINKQGWSSVGDEDNYESCDRSVKQAMLQLRHLGSVWRGVLPYNVYCKSIGTLINSVIVEIVNNIVSLDDISVADAECMSTILSYIQKMGPELIKCEDDEGSSASITALMFKNCNKWSQMIQLMFVLKASLSDISDRWADGLGPLAVEFSANQMKQLVRALFQNTDRRAALLLQLK